VCTLSAIESDAECYPADNTAAQANGAAAPLVWPRKYDLFGVGLSATTYDEVTTLILEAARRRRAAVASFHAVHAVVTASGDASLRQQVNTFEIVAPDGQPVRWALNWLYRTALADRVYGPELMLRLCRHAAEARIPVFLCGGSPEVAAALPDRLTERFPGLIIAGSHAPPFRPLSPEEDRQLVEQINASDAGIVFIGLGCPKQDRFAYEHRDRIRAVQVCVGAAFDLHAGRKQMAPDWMQRRGLEWLFRLSQEPGRLWKRYFLTNSIFVAKLLAACFRRRPAGSRPDPVT
jgi:exopolysaccharide biosynthesis WecB/TagA/CpsF family protein